MTRAVAPHVIAFLPPFTAMDGKDWIQVGILFFLLYMALRFLRRTIAGGLFQGPALLSWIAILSVFLLLKEQNLDVLNSLFRMAFPVLLIALAVLFQSELRHGMARLGRRSFLARISGKGLSKKQLIEQEASAIVNAVFEFAERRVGCLLAFERTVDLTAYVETGVPMDAVLRSETLDTIFITDTILHDGAAIIRGNRIAAAGCLLPLTERPEMKRMYGTRHRAAIGLSEESDALVVVVSEERGQILIATEGQFVHVSTREQLRATLGLYFGEYYNVTPTERDTGAAA